MRSIDTDSYGADISHGGLQGVLAVTFHLPVAVTGSAIVALGVHALAKFLARGGLTVDGSQGVNGMR